MNKTVLTLIGVFLMAASFGAFALPEQEKYGNFYEFENEEYNGVLAMKKMKVYDLCSIIYYCKINTNAPVDAYFTKITYCPILGGPMPSGVRIVGQIISGSTSGLQTCAGTWTRHYP